MRRMRGFEWSYILFLVPVVALGFGVKYFVSKKYSTGGPQELATLTKPSDFKAPSEKGESPKSDEAQEPAKTVAGNTEGKPGEHKAHAEKSQGANAHGGVHEAEDSESFEAALDATLKGQGKADGANRKIARNDSAPDASPRARELPVSSGEHGAFCSAVEYVGDGPNVQISAQEWDRVLAQYADVKKNLLDWLNRNRKGFPEKTAAFMEKQILNVKLQVPTAAKDPDLAWRGIGVLEHEGREGKDTVIRLGSGFLKLTNHQAARAKFELTRLVAQSFAPCELHRNGEAEAWAPLLKCLQVNESRSCAPGSYSEGGWAVSSTIAAMIAPPGCVLPAFRNTELANCLKKLPLPQSVAAASGKIEEGRSQWKESRR